MSVRWMTAREIARRLGQQVKSVSHRARRERWLFREGGERYGRNPGRRPRLYDTYVLPADVRRALDRPAGELLADVAPELLQRLEASTAELADYRDAMAACASVNGRVPDPADEAEIRSLSVEIERNQAAIARAKGLPQPDPTRYRNV